MPLPRLKTGLDSNGAVSLVLINNTWRRPRAYRDGWVDCRVGDGGLAAGLSRDPVVLGSAPHLSRFVL